MHPPGATSTTTAPPTTTTTPRTWAGLRADLIAGLTVAAVALPQGMAYALIAGIDPRFGLYTAIVMTALASLLGSSAHLINGPTNALSLVVFSAVSGIGLAVGSDDYLQAVFLLSLMVGAFQVLIYCFKLGDLTRYISESVILGFMVGAGALVALSQVPNLLGLRSAGEGGEHLLVRLWSTVVGGLPRPVAVLLGVGTAAATVGLRRVGRWLGGPVPDMLLALILASLAAPLFGWREQWPPFPPGLPSFHLPQIDVAWVRSLSGSALALAVLGLLEAIAIAKSIAARTRQQLDYNWQCLAEGLANIGGGLFQCMPGSGSLTRSAINYQAGAVTRLSGVISAAAVALTVVLFADLAKYVPRPALAGLLLVTAWRLVDRSRVAYCLRATTFDRNVLLATAAAAVFISIEFSILIGVFLSFVFLVPRASRLHVAELVVSRDRVVRERQADDPVCDRLAVLGLEGELFFGAAPELDAVFADLLGRAGRGLRVAVLRVKRTRNPDMVCLEKLQHFLEEMQRRRVPVLLCGVRDDFARALARLGFSRCLPAERVFLEETPSGEEVPALSSTLRAVKRAYEMLGADLCATCPRRQEMEKDWYYMI